MTVNEPYLPVARVVEALLDTNSHVATKYVSPREVIRATRTRSEDGRFPGGPARIVLSIGAPNYLEREFIKRAKKAGEPFPIKKIQLKALPKRAA